MASRSRIILLSLLSGLLWALAWPAIGGLAPFAFVAWLPLLYAERLHDRRTEGRHRAFTPYVLPALFVWNMSCSWWFACVSEPMITRLMSVGFPVLVNTVLMAVPWWLKRMVHRSHGPRVAAYAFILFWLSYEWLNHDWDMQWPWFTIGNVFGARPEMVQWYEYTGVLGGSLWVLVVSLLIDRAIVAWPNAKRSAALPLTTGVLVLIFPWIGSRWLFNSVVVGSGRAVEVVVVQPNVDPYLEKFGGTDPLVQLDRMLEQAEAVMTDSTVLIVLPETALQENATVDLSGPVPRTQGLWENDLRRSQSAAQIAEFQRRHERVAVLSGMSSAYLFPAKAELPVTARPLVDGRHWYEAYNAGLWMPADGAIESYHKSKLVAGVELMPFERWLGSLSALTVDLGGTSGSLAGQQERSVLRDPSSGIAVIPAICYESVFGEHVAAHVRNGGNLIAVITNDGWWGDSPGYHQHLTFSSLRAIEMRREVVRSANTGTSCTIDRRGVVHHATTWWVPTAFKATVHLNNEVTFYARYGDGIGRVALMFSALLLIMAFVRRWRTKRSV